MKVVLPLFMIFILLLTACREKTEGIKPEYRDVTEAVYSTVTVQPRNAYNVYPQVSGIIEYLAIEEGQEIKKGDIILRLTDTKSNVNVQSARLKYEIAKESYSGESAMLKEIEEKIKTAKVKVKNDSINYERQKRLWKQDVGSRLEYENRELAFDISKNELDILTNSYGRTKAELKRQMEIAHNSLKINKLSGDDFNVRSKLDGMVYSIEKEVGESVNPQTPIAAIGSKSDFILSLLIDEVDISKVFNGQKVIVSLDAYPDSVYEAKIYRIYPEKDERSLTFTIEAEFTTKPERLFKGLSGEANIVIQEKSNVLTLPSQYITEDQKVQTNDGLISVTTGLKSLEYTEILNGVDSSTLIKVLK